ncbi:homocysteine-responsive endoplasmic reticulum-resident ubiquitin-like domain member 1 protein [Amia ocellicauda]|uniref:homocysteine-responsive endoplasmic reticulum-resident ubiquitin-like domain member 1 protein n=1 Tax=Amia ocellicauda TaxID=2972642 RepID=UPI003463971C|nr:HERP1 protein [Amia calva]
MDNPGNPPELGTITVVVKSPNQAHEDRVIEGVQLAWTVGQLKTHLSHVYPTSPPEKDQRLIYSGKLLPDHLHIKDVFRKSDSMPTIHLVCSFKPRPGAQQGSHSKLTGASQHGETAHMESGNTASATAPPPHEDGLRHRGNPQGVSSATLGAAEMHHPAFATYSMYSPQQLLWLQQMYARQYYMQYQAALAAASSSSSHVTAGSPSLPVVSPPAPALANQAPVDNLPANQDAPQPQLINPGANQNLRMNAQGGPVMEDEEDMNRDWLDWIYTAARFSVFLSILYFYSSVSRFVLVMSSLLIMYLHTAGWFPFRRRAAQPGRDIPLPPEVVQNQHNQIRNQLQEEQLQPEGDGQEEATLQDVDMEPQRVSLVGMAWVFFKTFFSSLIPEGPQAMVN